MTTTAPDAGASIEVDVYGLRTFRVEARTGRLLPVSVYNHVRSGDVWDNGTCVAECIHIPGHAAPVEECSCGIYSFNNLDTLRSQYGQARDLVAVVALEGTVIEGEHGSRAQAARVVAVWTLRPEWYSQTIKNLGVPVFDDLDVMVAAYPGLRHTPAAESSLPALGRDSGQVVTSMVAPRWRWVRPVVRGVVLWWSIVWLYAAVFSSYHQLRLGSGPARTDPMAEQLERLQHTTTQLGAPSYAASLMSSVGLLAVMAVLVVTALGLLVNGGVPVIAYGIERLGRRLLRVLTACALAAALVGAPTALSSVEFWFTLAAMTALLFVVRVVCLYGYRLFTIRAPLRMACGAVRCWLRALPTHTAGRRRTQKEPVA